MKLSDSDFYSLPRYENGRIKDLSNVYFMLTEDQVEHLHGDDWSYYHELLEETEYELSLLAS